MGQGLESHSVFPTLEEIEKHQESLGKVRMCPCGSDHECGSVLRTVLNVSRCENRKDGLNFFCAHTEVPLGVPSLLYRNKDSEDSHAIVSQAIILFERYQFGEAKYLRDRFSDYQMKLSYADDFAGDVQRSPILKQETRGSEDLFYQKMEAAECCHAERNKTEEQAYRAPFFAARRILFKEGEALLQEVRETMSKFENEVKA